MDMQSRSQQCAIFDDFFDEDLIAPLLRWMGSVEVWNRVETGAHAYDSLDLAGVPLPNKVAHIASKGHLARIRASIEHEFGYRVAARTKIMMHRMSVGDVIGIHSDCEVSEIRVSVALGVGLLGGAFYFGGDTASTVRSVALSQHNVAIALSTGYENCHGVSPVRQGTRFSIVYRFAVPESANDAARGMEAGPSERYEGGRPKGETIITAPECKPVAVSASERVAGVMRYDSGFAAF